MTGSIEALQGLIPDHARDVRINLGVITSSTALAPNQAWLIAVTSAATARNPVVLEAVRAEAVLKGTPAETVTAGLAAASIMGMNNVYYRFLHMMGDDSDYGKMPARLRMQVLAKPGVDHLDFELACLAASAITGCEKCVRAHEQTVRDKGGTREQVQDAVRIASAIHAAAVALETA
jgi:lipoyl-dependent peroxiredoxin subunit D